MIPPHGRRSMCDEDYPLGQGSKRSVLGGSGAVVTSAGVDGEDIAIFAEAWEQCPHQLDSDDGNVRRLRTAASSSQAFDREDPAPGIALDAHGDLGRAFLNRVCEELGDRKPQVLDELIVETDRSPCRRHENPRGDR